MKRILITNDDGIDGAGLIVLADRISKLHDVEIYVMAPDSNRSAVSSLLTMASPMKFVRRRDKGVNWFSCSGSPVDCVIAGLSSNVFDINKNENVKFDAVISGINKGANLGTDVIYSGTCAAARQAVLYGVPGIALSVESYDGTWKFDALADFCAENLDKLISLSTKELFVSVNARSSDNYNGVVFSSLSIRDYCDRIKILEDPNGKSDLFYGFFKGGDIKSSGRKDEKSPVDFNVSFGGKISITRIFAEQTSFDDFSKIF